LFEISRKKENILPAMPLTQWRQRLGYIYIYNLSGAKFCHLVTKKKSANGNPTNWSYFEGEKKILK
jgi:hypothetical protein